MSQVNAKTLMLGQNADPAKNFKINVPTPEDGTLTIERANGADVLTVAANGQVKCPANKGPVLIGNMASVATIAGPLLLSPTIAANVAVNVVGGNQFVPTIPGYYQISLNMRISATSAPTFLGALIRNNGVNIASPYFAPYASTFVGASASILTYMNGTTDYIEFMQDLGGTPTAPVIQAANMSIVRVGEIA